MHITQVASKIGTTAFLVESMSSKLLGMTTMIGLALLTEE